MYIYIIYIYIYIYVYIYMRHKWRSNDLNMADVSKIDRSSKMMKIAMTENENVGLMRNLTQKAN